jgi:hypothetical protein
MEIDRNRRVVTPDACEGRAVRTTHVHHHDFPEVRAEGESTAAAGMNLANRLDRALDNTPSDYRRAVVTQATAESEFMVGR